MNIINIAGAAVTAAAIAVIVRQQKKEFGMFVSIAAGIFFFFIVVDQLQEILDFFGRVASLANVSSDVIVILIKALGICYITQFASDICKDEGESSIASKIELVGKLAILIISIPIFENILNLIIKIVG